MTTERLDRPRQTRPHGDERRRQIIDTALDLFSAGGYNTVSIADIARDVGITQAGLLHHFPSKPALLLGVLQARVSNNLREEERSLESGENYFNAFLSTLDRNERNPMLVQLYTVLSAESLAADHPGHDWFVSRYDSVVKSVTAALRGLVDESKLPVGATTETVARWLIGLGDGLRIQWLLNPEALSRHDTVQQFVQLLEPFLITSQSRSIS